MKVRIKRQDDRRSAPYWQVFHFRGEGRITVAAILEKLNERDQLEDIKGKQCRKIRWECGCMQKMCGGCAMVINGHPALACGVFINTDDTEILRLEPLTKFPVVEDLIVDRSVIWERQKEALMYLGIRKHPDPKEHDHQYSAAKCLKCGLCLEVCPNYLGAKDDFYGAEFANNAYLLHSSSLNPLSHDITNKFLVFRIKCVINGFHSFRIFCLKQLIYQKSFSFQALSVISFDCNTCRSIIKI